MKKSIYSLIAIAGLLASCSSEPTTITEGESFVFDGQNITVNVSSFSILSNDALKTTIIAPEGKVYLKLDAEADGDSYFATLKDGESSLEEVDYLIAKNFVETSDDIFDPNTHNLYLVDLSNTNYSVEFKSFVDEIATLNVGQLEDESTLELHPSMMEFVAEFSEGARPIDVVQSYLPEGTSAYDYITEIGMDVPANPIIKGLEIEYVKDKDSYECSSEFGIDNMIVVWSGDYITEVIFE